MPGIRQEEAMKKLSVCLIVVALVLAGCGGSVQPKAGATFVGAIAMDADKAESAILTFTISEDGMSITKIGVSFTKFKCEAMSAGQISVNSGGNFPIADGLTISPSNIGQIAGRFSSPTKASGTIHLQLKIDMGMGSISCDMGTWDWSADAK
jgi:hypothetical protein